VSVNDNPIPLPRMGGNSDDGDDIGRLMGPIISNMWFTAFIRGSLFSKDPLGCNFHWKLCCCINRS
jgi:hypothetical protein